MPKKAEEIGLVMDDEFVKEEMSSLTKAELLAAIIELKGELKAVKQKITADESRVYPDHEKVLEEIGMNILDMPVVNQLYCFKDDGRLRMLKTQIGEITTYVELIRVTHVYIPPVETERKSARQQKFCTVSFVRNSLNTTPPGLFDGSRRPSTTAIHGWSNLLKSGMKVYKPKAA